MSTTAIRPEIAAFAAAVRAHLDDLPADDVDELTDGLVADLSDQAEEAGDGFDLPDAAAYASELRAAAGLPSRAPGGRIRRTVDYLNTLDRRAADRARRGATALRSQPAIAWIVDILLALRPIWWLMRAGVLYVLVVPLLPISHPGPLDVLHLWVSPTVNLVYTVIFAVLVVVSVQWGRGRWAPFAWLRFVRTSLTVIAVIATPFVVATTVNQMQNAISSARFAAYEAPEPGLAVDGQRVRNIFAYDANGDPIDHVQLFDQDGRPLTTVGASGQGDEWDYYFYGGGGPLPVPEREIGRQPVWNVFPLRELPANDAMTMYGDPLSVTTADATAPTFPFARVPSVAPSDATGADVPPGVPTASPAP